MISIRPATLDDAPAMSAVLIASITELCGADHKNNPDALASWLANKTPDGIAQWFGNPANSLFVAERDGEIAAVGAVNRPPDDPSQLRLAPPSLRGRQQGACSPRWNRIWGRAWRDLESSQTARQLYLDAGWVEAGPPEPHQFVPGYPMRKILS